MTLSDQTMATASRTRRLGRAERPVSLQGVRGGHPCRVRRGQGAVEPTPSSGRAWARPQANDLRRGPKPPESEGGGSPSGVQGPGSAFAHRLSAWPPLLRPHSEGRVTQGALPSLGTSVSLSMHLAGTSQPTAMICSPGLGLSSRLGPFLTWGPPLPRALPSQVLGKHTGNLIAHSDGDEANHIGAPEPTIHFTDT